MLQVGRQSWWGWKSPYRDGQLAGSGAGPGGGPQRPWRVGWCIMSRKRPQVWLLIIKVYTAAADLCEEVSER